MSGYANAACLAPRALPLHASLPRQAQVAPGFTLPARVVGPNGETTPGTEEYRRQRTRQIFFNLTPITTRCATANWAAGTITSYAIRY